jgi:catechol 2,3-dioxygenase-like lactoylglutathione lyase family enzyme
MEMNMANQMAAPWPKAISAVTIFVEDMAAAKEFYQLAFGLPVFFEDDDSTVFNFGNVVINLLSVTAAPELIEPAAVGGRDAGRRFVLTVEVENVDSICPRLNERGIKLLNGPMDRPWGVRTASFIAPEGTIWEIAK